MRKKKLWIFIGMILILINSFIFLVVGRFVDPHYDLEVKINLNATQNMQLAYTTEAEVSSETLKFMNFEQVSNDGTASLQMQVPIDIQMLRIDFGDIPGEKAEIQSISLNVLAKSYDLKDVIQKPFMIHNIETSNDSTILSFTKEDPYIIYQLDGNSIYKNWVDLWTLRAGAGALVCLIIDTIVIILVLLALKNTEICSLLDNRRTIWNLSKRDFKTKYAGSYLGIFWAFIQPIVTILLYWFVFEVGFRSAPTNGFPFVLWLISGLIPWFLFSDAITAVTTCLLEYSYLVKKVVFNIKMLPIIKIISALFVHVFFICFTILIFKLNGYGFNLYMVQVLYYLIAAIALVLGIGFITSSVVVFFRDLGQIVQIFLQIGVWMTPIMWNLSIISPSLQAVFKLNPAFYIVEGYRDSFINRVWFWEKPFATLYYWLVVILIFWIGNKIFNRLRSHFADIL